MASESDKQPEKISAWRLLKRFGHLLLAQGSEAIFSTAFFLYLAWIDSEMYGQVMYGIAAGTIVQKIVLFGLYYPLVQRLGEADPSEAPGLLNQVNAVRLILLIPAAIFIYILAQLRDFSLQMTWVVFFVVLGFGLEAISETFFAEFRVRGRQDREARAKIAGNVLGFGYGLLCAAFRVDPIVTSLFKIVSSSVRLGFIVKPFWRPCVMLLRQGLPWAKVWAITRIASVFAAVEILGNIYNKTNIFFMENAVGVKGVAYFSATWSLLDPISVLASSQFLGWVIFPVLALLWFKNRGEALRLVWSNALWLMAVALPIMFILYAESELMIGLVYPDEYSDAVWMQKLLVWTILISFENNLFNYVMMVAGAQKLLLLFAIATTVVNLIFNIVLIDPLGLTGGCLVIILTKLVMCIFTFSYCQWRFHLFKIRDFVFPVVLGGTSAGLYALLQGWISKHPAVILTLLFYGLIVWKFHRLLGAPKTVENVCNSDVK